MDCKGEAKLLKFKNTIVILNNNGVLFLFKGS